MLKYSTLCKVSNMECIKSGKTDIKDKYERLDCLHYPYDAQSIIDHCDDDKETTKNNISD